MNQEIIQINEHTWRIEDGFVRFFLLEGTKSALLIDSGASSPDAKDISQSLTSLPIQLLNTHGDGDHTAGNGAFSSVLIHPADWAGCGMSQKYPDCTPVAIQDGDTIDLGGRVLNVIGIPGHTRGSVAILDQDARMLFSGDSVQSGTIFMFGGHRVPDELAASLQKLIDCADCYDVIYPSHAEPELPKDYVQKVLDGWTEVCNGTLTPVRENLFGNSIDHYTAQYCGFYCNPKE